ncbi:DUF1697 domain-containing protein [Leptolyngbya sp. 7M]|uniref:DUF1697 domain-containing protein n=1 Tax=Leptolyngbya sp. 7M TaxID=2812896 RepID=UPI001B8CA99A|nr:DUF1697 domain-containing protein [Leptolyngbya sp. 7M]QYO68289.1 DUF1697 domain-containing protein [Leptolyngbya sp. 7M]
MPRFVALLRGINVGGNTMLKMSDLKPCLERAGLDNVVTYINSGNIGFDSDRSESDLIGVAEAAIATEFERQVPVMIRSRSDVVRIISANPFDGEFESHKEMHVLFLKDEMPLDKQQQLIEAATPPERFAIVGREIYCHLPMGVADSLLGKSYIEKKLKLAVTARNWRTVQKLVEL